MSPASPLPTSALVPPAPPTCRGPRLPAWLARVVGLAAVLGGWFWLADTVTSVPGRLSLVPEGAEVETVEEFWPNGRIHVRRQAARLGDGRLVNHGRMRVWYEDGAPRSEGMWRDGRKHGRFVHWHRNGRKEKENAWRDGEPDGLFEHWDADGRSLERQRWERGRLVESQPAEPR